MSGSASVMAANFKIFLHFMLNISVYVLRIYDRVYVDEVEIYDVGKRMIIFPLGLIGSKPAKEKASTGSARTGLW